MIKRKVLRLLYKSFDAELSAKEEQILKQAFGECKDLEHTKQTLHAIRNGLADGAAGGFHPFFADKVMHKINNRNREIRKVYFFESLRAAFRRVALAGALAILILLSFNILQGLKITANPTLDEILVSAFTISLEEFYED